MVKRLRHELCLKPEPRWRMLPSRSPFVTSAAGQFYLTIATFRRRTVQTCLGQEHTRLTFRSMHCLCTPIPIASTFGAALTALAASSTLSRLSNSRFCPVRQRQTSLVLALTHACTLRANGCGIWETL